MPFVLYNSLLFGGCGNTMLTYVRVSDFWNCINCNSPVERLEKKKKTCLEFSGVPMATRTGTSWEGERCWHVTALAGDLWLYISFS